MVRLQQIRQLAGRIARGFGPERIILFGSYARGEATTDSDVDLLMVMRCRGKTYEKEFKIRQAIRAPFPLDLIVRTPGEMARGVSWNDFFITDIVANGKVLYE